MNKNQCGILYPRLCIGVHCASTRSLFAARTREAVPPAWPRFIGNMDLVPSPGLLQRAQWSERTTSSSSARWQREPPLILAQAKAARSPERTHASKVRCAVEGHRRNSMTSGTGETSLPRPGYVGKETIRNLTSVPTFTHAWERPRAVFQSPATLFHLIGVNAPRAAAGPAVNAARSRWT